MKRNQSVYFIVMMLLCGLQTMAQNTLEQQMERKAEALIQQMTLDEKIAQMQNAAPAIERLGLKRYNWWSEALHGVARDGRATMFPQPIGLAATFDVGLIHSIGDAISTEGRAKFGDAQRIGNRSIYAGLTYWAPNVNIFRDPRWGRGMETYGEDPFLSGTLGTAFVRGIQGNDPFYLKAAACAKHFAVHSGPESTRHSANVEPSLRDLWETYLPAFRMLVENGHVEAVMGSYNRVYGDPACGSKFLLTEILRQKWGFRGHVVSDCGALWDIPNGHKVVNTPAEAAAMAVKAGLNLECGNLYSHLKEAVGQKLVTEKEIDAALKPVLMTRMKLGLVGTDPNCPYNNIPTDSLCTPWHRTLALKSARESMVLLKNNGVLPLSPETPTVYVSGPGATDGFYLMGNYYGVPDHLSTFLEGISANVSPGTSINYRRAFLQVGGDDMPVSWGAQEGKDYDVHIIFVGNNGDTEGEEGDAIAATSGADRASMALPESQLKFIRKAAEKRHNKLVVVVTGGSPVELKEIAELADAVVLAWYPGQEGGEALGQLLFGKASFSGRLPVTFPESTGSLPPMDDYNMQGRTYKYMTSGIQYPFGYGLTYGKVVYSDVKATPSKQGLTVTATVSNSGRDCEEVAQVYLSAPGAGISAPNQQLVAFQRVNLPAGSSRTVSIQIPRERLMTVQKDGSSKLIKGEYRVVIGGCAPSSATAASGVSHAEVKVKM